MVFKKMIKTASPKAIIIRTNLICLAFFLGLYLILLLCPPAFNYHDHATEFVKCSFRNCHHKENGDEIKAILEEPNGTNGLLKARREFIQSEKPSSLNGIGGGMKIGMVNMDDEDVSEWKAQGQIIPITFEIVSDLFKWEALFPEWIDEEGASCPEIPMPDYNEYEYMDMIVAKLPCKIPEEGWSRDVFRLQVHLIVANLAVRRGRRDSNEKVKVVLVSKCMPMVELFPCSDLVRREGELWYYKVEIDRMEQKVSLPVGSCKLALPLWEWDKGINKVYDVSKRTQKREAYATVIHSSEAYVCGAITLAQSLLRTSSQRDLVLLLDTSISEPKRDALKQAGWKLRFIKRIRNPKAKNISYNKYNYSKFRLWQLTDYDKVVFIDSDIIVLRNLDILFSFPQMSAIGNNGFLFNSGIMLIEPSNCMFHMFMKRLKEIASYNGGDQGFLNEVFVWWHRFPRSVNFMKYIWSNSSIKASEKNQLFGSEPPKLYSIHYLGLKPWLCYRDYDCNFDVPSQRVYASDAAHARWWKLHDTMDEGLQKLCALSNTRKVALERRRKEAQILGLIDHHWKINVTDPRRFMFSC